MQTSNHSNSRSTDAGPVPRLIALTFAITVICEPALRLADYSHISPRCVRLIRCPVTETRHCLQPTDTTTDTTAAAIHLLSRDTRQFLPADPSKPTRISRKGSVRSKNHAARQLLLDVPFHPGVRSMRTSLGSAPPPFLFPSPR